jgi:hypothetical protein
VTAISFFVLLVLFFAFFSMDADGCDDGAERNANFSATTARGLGPAVHHQVNDDLHDR